MANWGHPALIGSTGDKYDDAVSHWKRHVLLYVYFYAFNIIVV
jgi:hypothetical protein